VSALPLKEENHKLCSCVSGSRKVATAGKRDSKFARLHAGTSNLYTALALILDLRIMRGLVVIDGWFDMNPDSAVGYQTTLPIGGLRMNDYTPPSIVMDVGSNYFRL